MVSPLLVCQDIVVLQPSVGKKKVQWTLAKFFKPEAEAQLALPGEWQPQKRSRGRPPKQLPIEALQAEEEALRAGEEEHERMKAHRAVISKMKVRLRNRGVAGRQGSNRVQHHQVKKKFEISAAAKVAICEKMIASRSEYASENDWMKEQMRKYGLT